MKFRDLPVYIDLLRLPLPVVFKRVSERFYQKKKAYHLPEIPDFQFKRLNLDGLGDLEMEGLSKLYQYYKEDVFNHLGSGWISIRNKDLPEGFSGYQYAAADKELDAHAIAWQRDQRSGFPFKEQQPAQALASGFNTPGVDVKFAWDFARFQHFPQMGLLAINSPAKLEEIQSLATNQFSSFLNQCPLGVGVHWASPMEVSIRLCNLLVGLDLLNLLEHFKESLYQHWHYLQAHLEDKQGLGTNHYLSNLIGLVVAGFFMKDAKVSEKSIWAWQELEQEVQKQFFKDGFNFEYSVYYHRLATEMLLVACVFAKRQGLKISIGFQQTLSNALQVIAKLKKPHGYLPQFGDNDSGRIIDLLPEGEWAGGEFTPQPEKSEFLNTESRSNPVYRWFYGDLESDLPKPIPIGYKSVNLKYTHLEHKQEKTLAFKPIDTSALSVTHFGEGGVIVFSSEVFYLAINLMASPKGHRYRGHSHNDKGTLELQVHGENLVQDPGVYSYTALAEIRNRWRKTEAHAVPYAGLEQNRYLPGNLGLFHMKLDTKTELLHLSKTRCVFEIKYRGIKHIREVEILQEKIRVADSCNKPFIINWEGKVPITKGYGKLA